MRSEYYELQLVTLVLDMNDTSSDKIPLLEKVVERIFCRKERQAYEQEYLGINGYLHTRRLVEARDLKSVMDTKLVLCEIARTVLDGHSRLELSTLSSDPTAAPRSVQPVLPEASQESADRVGDHLDIMVRAVWLQSQNRATSLERRWNLRYYKLLLLLGCCYQKRSCVLLPAG